MALQATVGPREGRIRTAGTEMAGEAESRPHGPAGKEVSVFRGGDTQRGLDSSSHRHEDLPRASLSSSSSLSSSPSSGSGVESDDEDAIYPRPQSEYEEIPSFRWIATPLRWWKSKKGSDLRRQNSADAWAANGCERPRIAGGIKVLPGGKIGKRLALPPGKRLARFDGLPIIAWKQLQLASVQHRGSSAHGYVKYTFEDGKEVDVRILESSNGDFVVKDFVGVLNMLGKVRHPNVLPPKAYCIGPRGDKILVFDYMPKGSLSDFLYGTFIDWPTRMDIAIGAARGLHHLHTQENMVHGNLSSKNILLDHHANVKVGGYGFSNFYTITVNSYLTETICTSGFHAPERFLLQKGNSKTDVYDLGMIMLELLTGKSPGDLDERTGMPSGLNLKLWIESNIKVQMSAQYGFWDAVALALACVNPSPNLRPEVQEVLQRLEGIKSKLARAARSTATSKRRRKPRKEGVWITATSATAAEKITAPPSKDVGVGTSNTSSILANNGNLLRARMTEHIAPLASLASGEKAMPTLTNSCKDKEEELAQTTLQGDPHECDIPSPSPAEEITRSPSGEEELQAPRQRNCFMDFPIAHIDEKATAEGGTDQGKRSMEGIDAMSEGTMASQPLSSIDWAKVAMEVHLQVPTSRPLFRSNPDSVYQRFLQALHDLAGRSPPLPSNVLEEQLNRMIVGLHSVGYPLEAWLKAANLLLVLTKKREHIEHYVDDYKVNMEAQLEELASAITPVKEEVSRAQSDVANLKQKKKGLDKTIAELEGQLALCKAQVEEVVHSLTMARGALAVAEAKMESMSIGVDYLKQRYSGISDLLSAMLSELPSLDEVLDSSIKEIMTRKF